MSKTKRVDGLNVSFRIVGSFVFLEDRNIGSITRSMDGKKVFVSHRKRSVHFFRKFKGWGLSQELLEFLRRNKFDQVHLRIGQRETLISNVDDWLQHGKHYHKTPFEPQLVLAEKHMTQELLQLSQIMER